MFYTTSGEKKETPISKEAVLDQLIGLLLRDDVSQEYADAIGDVHKLISEMPAMETAAGKRLVKRYYPRICVKANFIDDSKPYQIGNNSHDELRVLHCDNSSFLTYLNLQAFVGTEFEDEGYSFVGKQYPDEWGDKTEYIPFDEVWVEEKEKEDDESASD